MICIAYLAHALKRGHAIHVEEHLERLYFEEEQRFPPWIKAIALLSVVVLIYPAILMWMEGSRFVPIALIFTALALVALVGGVLTFRMKLVTKLDSSHLRLRIEPFRWALLPRRMTHKDIPLSDISQWRIRTYNPLLSTEYWGWHFWGLSVARGGRYLYMMRPSSPVSSGRGVQLWLVSSERVLVGTEHPEEFANAISAAKGGSR
jgi:hypothetical protein